jgi:hypothetical protein
MIAHWKQLPIICRDTCVPLVWWIVDCWWWHRMAFQIMGMGTPGYPYLCQIMGMGIYGYSYLWALKMHPSSSSLAALRAASASVCYIIYLPELEISDIASSVCYILHHIFTWITIVNNTVKLPLSAIYHSPHPFWCEKAGNSPSPKSNDPVTNFGNIRETFYRRGETPRQQPTHDNRSNQCELWLPNTIRFKKSHLQKASPTVDDPPISSDDP